jgi:type IV pilus assembly protein PilB
MKNLDRLSRKKLGEILIDEGVCTRAQVEEALAIQQQRDDPLGEILLDTCENLTEIDIARAIATSFSFPCLMAGNYKINTEALALVGRAEMYEYTFIPIDTIGNTLVIVMGGLMTSDLITQIENETGREVFVYVSMRSDVLSCLQHHAPYDPETDTEGAEDFEDDFDWEKMFDEADKSLLMDD